MSYSLREKVYFNLNLLILIFLVGCQTSTPYEANELATKKVVPGNDKVVTLNNSPTTEEKVITPVHGITPTELYIPSINLQASIISVGLLKDGSMEVPENVMEVGWYEPGAKPGQSGNVVLAGHVDNYLGPGIFANLDQVSISDEITVTNGTEETIYKVIEIESYPYQDGPVEEIFGFTAQKRLHLITCTGKYNPFKRTHEERLVVTAIAE